MVSRGAGGGTVSGLSEKVPVYKHFHWTEKLEHSAFFVELRWSRAAEYLLLQHVVPNANTAGFFTIINASQASVLSANLPDIQ